MTSSSAISRVEDERCVGLTGVLDTGEAARSWVGLGLTC